MTTTEEGHIDPHVFNSYYPFLLAIGGAVALTGIAVHPAVFVAGMMVVLYSVVQLAIHSEGLPKFKSRFEDMSPDEHILGGMSTFKMGIWMFLISEILFFTGLIGTGIALRVRSDWWAEPGEILNVPLTAANTFFLICSSMTMVEALRAAELGDNRRMRIALLATMGIGILFVSIQVVEYLEPLHPGPQQLRLGVLRPDGLPRWSRQRRHSRVGDHKLEGLEGPVRRQEEHRIHRDDGPLLALRRRGLDIPVHHSLSDMR